MLFVSVGVASAESTGERSLPAMVSPGEEFVVTVDAYDYGLLGQVIETLPAGFDYVGQSGAFNVEEVGNEITFTVMGTNTFTYNVTATVSEGTYEFTGTIEDSTHYISNVSGDIEVVVKDPTLGLNDLPNAIISTISPNPSFEGDIVTFNGTGTDADGTIAAYCWNSSLDGQLGTSAIFSASNLSLGNHNIYFRVQDNDGAWSETDSATLIIDERQNVVPIVTISSISPNPAFEGDTVTFNGTGTDVDGSIAAYYWNSSLDGQLGTSAIFSASNLSLGNHTIYFRVQDNDGAWSETDSATLIINENTTGSNNDISVSSGGSSSSSGGGSGASGEAFENIAFKDVKSENIIGGLEICYDFNEEQNAILYVIFSAVKNYGKVSTTIEVLKDRSTMVVESAPGIVYQNLNIWVGKAGFATNDNIADPVIGFSVSRTWLIDNELDESSVAMYRYNNSKWHGLNTIKVREDDQYIYFEAETPGFSPFAISADAEEDDIPIVKEIGSKDVENGSKTEAETLSDDMPVSESNSVPGISMSLSFILVGCAYIVSKSKR